MLKPKRAKTKSLLLPVLLAATLATAALAAKGHDDHADHADHGQRSAVAARDERAAADSHDEPVDHDSADAHAGHGHGPSDPDAFCEEHRLPEREDALCNPDLIAGLQPGAGLNVRLAASDVAGKAGIAVARPQRLSTAAGVQLPGRSEFNRNRLARVTALSAGVVRRAAGEIGQRVAKGELLAEIASPEGALVRGQHGGAVARLAQAEAAYAREKELFGKGISSRLEFEQAEADLRAAQSEAGQLREQLAGYGVAEQGGSQVRLRAPLSGVIVEKSVALGDVVAAGTPLYTIADPAALWIELAVPEARVGLVEVGARVEASFDGLPGSRFSGRIVTVAAALDERSRTLKATAEIANPGGRLKAGMFGRVKLLAAGTASALAVPVGAVQSIDRQNFLFVRKEKDLFELRRVELGGREEGLATVVFGLAPDEEVVVAQGFALKSEVLKARLGASCADH